MLESPRRFRRRLDAKRCARPTRYFIAPTTLFAGYTGGVAKAWLSRMSAYKIVISRGSGTKLGPVETAVCETGHVRETVFRKVSDQDAQVESHVSS
ncbi:hypothetical protein BHE74_00021953 [Ensete ventricosum]|nr:hypothetical protein BHE74_00021953 [Ensete ventricosum]